MNFTTAWAFMPSVFGAARSARAPDAGSLCDLCNDDKDLFAVKVAQQVID